MKYAVSILFLLSTSCSGQNIFSNILDSTRIITPLNLLEWKNQIIVSGIFSIEDEVSTILFFIDKNTLQVTNEVIIEEIRIDRKGIILDDDFLFVVGLDVTGKGNSYKSAIVDENYMVTVSKSQEFDDFRNSIISATTLNNFYFLASRNTVDPSINSRITTRLTKLNSDQDLVFSEILGAEHNKVFHYYIENTSDDNLMLTSSYFKLPINAYGNFIFGSALKISPNGDTIWNFETPKINSFINSTPSVINHKSKDFIFSFSSDHLNDQQWENTISTPINYWLDSSGVCYNQKELIYPANTSIIDHRLIESVHKNHFFGIGRKLVESDDYIVQHYAWIYKMDNTGTMIWERNLSHDRFVENSISKIFDAIELENGDILFIAQIIGATTLGWNAMPWIVRLNQNGCIQEEDCPDELLVNYSNLNSQKHALDIFPIPFKSDITIACEKLLSGEFLFYNIHGQKILERSVENSNMITINAANLPSGILFLHYISSNGDREIRKLIKNAY